MSIDHINDEDGVQGEQLPVTVDLGRPELKYDDYGRVIPSSDRVYNPARDPITVYKLAMLGFTDDKIADTLGISIYTLQKWAHSHNEIFLSLCQGRHRADADVAMALHKRAVGYEVTEQETTATADGDIKEIKTKTKHIAPDTAAAKHWLSKRQPELWADQQQIQHSVSGTLEDLFNRDK